MVDVRGYSEEEVDVLADILSDMMISSLRTVAEKTAAQLRPAILSSAAFHLPGKHDQKSHGRATSRRPVKVLEPYGDYGGAGKRMWMGETDEDIRAAGMWSDTYEGQRGVVETMRAMHAGEADPTADVKVEGPLSQQAKIFNYDTDEVYGEDAVKADIFNAAANLDERLEAAPEIDYPLHRGMRVSNPGDLRVGDTFDSDVSSWSTSQDIARHYTLPQEGSLRPEVGVPVIMTMTSGGRALDISGDVHPRMQAAGEHLARGSFRITSARYDNDGTLFVEVEQI